jgi:CubicO group peptidase (beta-lactamase class C family)
VSVDQRKIDALFKDQAGPGRPGYAVGVLQDGQIVHAKGYGMADLEHGVPISPDTVFHVASLSKQLTACAVLILKAQNRLSLNDGLREPKRVPEVGPFADRVTLRHLLSHTSGLRDQWPMLRLAGWREMDEKTEGDVLDLVRGERRLNFPQGTDFCYCNTGYTLLALIVNRITGKPLRDFATEKIFTPLGMHATRIRDDHSELMPGRACGYKGAGPGRFGFWVPNFDLAGPTNLHSTVGDLLRWADNLMAPRAGFAPIVKDLLQPGTLDDGRQVGYGAGVGLGVHRGLSVVRHSGWDLGYASHLALYPTERFAVAILANLATLEPWVKARRVAELFLASRFDPQPGETPHLAKHELTEMDGLYRHTRNGRVLRVLLSNGRLVLSPTGLPSSASAPLSGKILSPRGPAKFVADDETTEVEFNGPTMTVRDEFGVDEPFDRVAASDPKPAELESYAGTYRCTELDATLTVSVGPGGLVVRQQKWPARALSPAYEDAFNDDKTTYMFTRAGGGRVDGVKLSLERVHNLPFERL